MKIHEAQDRDLWPLDLLENKPFVIGCGPNYPLKEDFRSCPAFRSFLEEYNLQFDPMFVPAKINKLSYQKAVNKAFSPSADNFDMDILVLAWEMVERHFFPYMSNSDITPLVKAIQNMPKDTSPGVAWRMLRRKDKVLEFVGEEYFVQWWDMIADYKCPGVYFSGNLKQELRMLQKVVASKTRMFFSGPIEHYLVGCQLFLDQNDKLVDNLGKHNSCVGISFQHGFARKLYNFSRKYDFSFCSDFSGWDVRMCPMMLWCCAILRYRMLKEELQTPENWKRIFWYYDMAINSGVSMCSGIIAQQEQGNPSGQFCTAEDNTFVLMAIFCYNWLKNGGKPEDFEDHVKLFLYGDDSVCFYDQFASTIFNPCVFYETCKEIGYEVEFADTLEFLGRQIQFSDYYNDYVGVMTKDRLLSALYAGPVKWTALKTWERACGIRIESFTNREAFRICDSYCRYLMQIFGNEITDFSAYIPESQLWNLYCLGDDSGNKINGDINGSIAC